VGLKIIIIGRCEASYGPAPSGQSVTKQSSWDRPGLLTDCRGAGVSNLAVSASLSPRSTSTTQRRLASGAANHCLWLTTRRRGRPHCCSAEAGFRARQHTHLPLWQFGRCYWDPRLDLQASSQSSRETPRLEWLYQPCLRRSRHSRAEGTSRSGSERREATLRLHSYTLAWWQTSGLGRHSVHHSGCFVRGHRQSINRSRCRTRC